MEKSDNKGLLSVHLAVFLFGVVGLFAKLVDLPAVIIVLGRVLFSSVFLWGFLLVRRQRIRLKRRADYLWMIAAGCDSCGTLEQFHAGDSEFHGGSWNFGIFYISPFRYNYGTICIS